MRLFPKSSASRPEAAGGDAPAGPALLPLQSSVINAGGCRLELHIHIHQGAVGGAAVSVNQVQGQTQQQRALFVPGKHEALLEQLSGHGPLEILRYMGVQDPERFVLVPKARVMQAVRAVLSKGKVKKKAGWIASALLKGWDLDEWAEVEGDEGTVGPSAGEVGVHD